MPYIKMPKTDKDEMQWSNYMSKIWSTIDIGVLNYVKWVKIISINFVINNEIN